MSADPSLVIAAVGAVLTPLENLVDDAVLSPQEQLELDIQATQSQATLAAAQSGATTAAASEATKQQAIKYAFAAALVLAAVWAFSRRR